MTKNQRQPIRGFEVPFTASWQCEFESKNVLIQIEDGRKITGDIWSVALVVNQRVIVTGFGRTSKKAEQQCWALLASYAKPQLVDIRMAAEAIEGELRWTQVEVLALVFAFCRSELGPIAYAGLVRDDEKKRKGRGALPAINQTTTLIARMIEGWLWLTGREIGFSEGGWLTRAVEAVAPYCHLKTRKGMPINNMRDALGREAPKYSAGLAVWAPTRMTAWPVSCSDAEVLTLSSSTASALP